MLVVEPQVDSAFGLRPRCGLDTVAIRFRCLGRCERDLARGLGAYRSALPSVFLFSGMEEGKRTDQLIGLARKLFRG